MTNPPIRETTKEGIGGIIKRGRPADLWMAKSEVYPIMWTGADADGEHAEFTHGAFRDVLTWLMVRAGIMPAKGEIKNRNMSRDPEYCARGSTGAELRIAGAEIRPWTDASPDEPLEAQPDYWRRSLSYANTRKAAEDMDINERILALLAEGKIYDEIGDAVGLQASAVCSRIRAMKKRGVEVPPTRRERERARCQKQDQQIAGMVRDGRTAEEISGATGLAVSYVYRRIHQMKAKGEIE